MSKLLVIIAALSFSAPSPLRALPISEPAMKAELAVQEEAIETRVYVRKQCLLSEPVKLVNPDQPEFLGAVAAMFVPLLIDKALGGVSSALRKAGSPETLRDSGKLPTYLYQLTRNGESRKLAINSNLGCVIVVRGTFSGADPKDQSTIQNFSPQGVFLGDSDADELRRIQRLRQNQIPVSTFAAVYEARIVKSNDKSALHYEGRFFEVNSFQGSRSAKSRGMVVSLAIHGPGTREGESLLSLALQNLGDVERETIVGPDQLQSKRSSWLGGVGMTDAAVKSLETLIVDNGKTVGVMPVTLEATFVELEKGKKALTFIADVLDAKKEPLTKAISDEILEGPKRAKEEASALETLFQEEETAYAAYLGKQSDLAGSSPLAAGATAAQQAAHSAALKVKQFEVDRTKRLWCNKFKALRTIGSAPSRPEPCN